MNSGNSGTGLIVLMGVLVLLFLSPALLCSGLGGMDGDDAFGSLGAVCSVVFWLALAGGAIMLMSIRQSNDDDDGDN